MVHKAWALVMLVDAMDGSRADPAKTLELDLHRGETRIWFREPV